MKKKQHIFTCVGNGSGGCGVWWLACLQMGLCGHPSCIGCSGGPIVAVGVGEPVIVLL